MLFLYLGSLLLSSCTANHDQAARPSSEVENLINQMMIPGAWKETEDGLENVSCPGWSNPANRAALSNYIATHSNPKTEDCYLAMVALDVTENHSPGFNFCNKAAERAARMNEVLSHSHNPGTLKWASLVRISDLFYAQDVDEQEKQTELILRNIEDYKSEKAPYFLWYLKVCDETPKTLEPCLRDLLESNEAQRGRFAKALTISEELKAKFPAYEPRRVSGQIQVLKHAIAHPPVDTGLDPIQPMFLDKLDLTAEQKEKIKPVIADKREKIMAVRSDRSLSPKDRRAKNKAIYESADASLKEIFTAEQYAKMEALRKERMGRYFPNVSGNTSAKSDAGQNN